MEISRGRSSVVTMWYELFRGSEGRDNDVGDKEAAIRLRLSAGHVSARQLDCVEL